MLRAHLENTRPQTRLGLPQARGDAHTKMGLTRAYFHVFGRSALPGTAHGAGAGGGESGLSHAGSGALGPSVAPSAQSGSSSGSEHHRQPPSGSSASTGIWPSGIAAPGVPNCGLSRKTAANATAVQAPLHTVVGATCVKTRPKSSRAPATMQGARAFTLKTHRTREGKALPSAPGYNLSL